MDFNRIQCRSMMQVKLGEKMFKCHLGKEENEENCYKISTGIQLELSQLTKPQLH